MNPLDVPEVEERLTQMLAHYDEATRSGKPTALDLDSAPPGLRERFEELRGCVDLLEGAWQRRERLAAEEADPEFLAMLEAPAQIGRFHIVRLLGRGGSGSVYLAHDPKLRREVALKIPSRETVRNPLTLERVWREAQVTAKLNHANLVPILDVVEIDKVPCLVSVYVRGVSLATWLTRNGPADPHDAARFVAALADGVANMSDCGVVHRDLKPANILLQRVNHETHERHEKKNGATRDEASAPASLSSLSWFTPKIVDFGLALDEYRSTQLTQDGAILGTVPYMSPEQVEGKLGTVGHRSDVHALGAILYEMLTGRPPFTGNSAGDLLRQIGQDGPVPPSTLRPGIPTDLETICLRCLEKVPARRCTAVELADELRRFLAGEPIRSRPLGRAGRFLRTVRQHSRQLAAALVLLALGMGIAFAAHWAINPASLPAKSAEALAWEARERAFGHFHEGEISEGMHALAGALQLVPPEAAELENLIRLDLAVCQQAVIRRHADFDLPRALQSLTFSPDGKLLLAVMQGGGVQLWDVEAKKPRGELQKHERDVLKAAFSPDGRTYQTACEDGKIRTGDVATGNLLGPVKVVTGPADEAGTAEGRREVVNRLLWELVTGKPLPASLKGRGMILGLELSEDRKAIHSLLTGPALQTWDVETALPVGPAVRLPKAVVGSTWRKDGSSVATAYQVGSVGLRGAGKADEYRQLPPFGKVQGIAWGERSTLLAGYETSVRLWETNFGNLKYRLSTSGQARFVAADADGQRLASANGAYSVRVWQLPERWPTVPPPTRAGYVLTTREGKPVQGGGVMSIALHPSGTFFGTAGLDEAVHFWDVKTREPFGAAVQHERKANCAAFSPDGRLVATGGSDGVARVWDAATRQPISQTAALKGMVCSVSISPDGETFVTIADREPPHLWETRTGKWVRDFRGLETAYVAVFSPDGKSVLLGGEGPHVLLHDLRTERDRMFPHPKSVWSAAFSPDGQSFLTGDEEGMIRWWDCASGLRYPEIRGHAKIVLGAGFSADGRWAVTCACDHTVRFWHPGTGKLVGPPLQFPDQARTAAFLPDGKTVLIGCNDRKVHFVPLPQPVQGTPREVRRTAEQATGSIPQPARTTSRLDSGIQGAPSARLSP